MAVYRGPYNGEKCTATCWKGDPNPTGKFEQNLQANARCKLNKGHPGKVHRDSNGVEFTGTGKNSKALFIINNNKPQPRPKPKLKAVQEKPKKRLRKKVMA